MKRVTFVCVLAAIALMGAYSADPAEGLWKSIDEKTGEMTAFWRIYERDARLYGEIITVPKQSDDTIAADCKASYKDFPVKGDVNKMTVVNTPFIFGLTKKASGEWAGGNIIDPKDGKIYKCKIRRHAPDGKDYKEETLEMRGEIGLGIGRSQYWKRTDLAEIEANRFKQ